jgi:pilus assembly protein TadC
VTALLLASAALFVLPPQQAGRARLVRLRPPLRPRDVPSGGADPLPVLAGLGVGALVAVVVGGWAGTVLAVPVAAAVLVASRRVLGRDRAEAPDPLALAAGWDLLAACLRAGLTVPAAVRVVAGHLPAEPGGHLRTVAERLALGATARDAWEVPEGSPVRRLADAARRSADSGAGLAAVAARAALDARTVARDTATARGQRAAVLITGPLGLCFLPAFLVLGVAPVVIGLGSGLAQHW